MSSFVVFAIFNNSCYIGFLTWLNCTTLKPHRMVMLYVKFKNHGCSDFKEMDGWMDGFLPLYKINFLDICFHYELTKLCTHKITAPKWWLAMQPGLTASERVL